MWLPSDFQNMDKFQRQNLLHYVRLKLYSNEIHESNAKGRQIFEFFRKNDPDKSVQERASIELTKMAQGYKYIEQKLIKTLESDVPGNDKMEAYRELDYFGSMASITARKQFKSSLKSLELKIELNQFKERLEKSTPEELKQFGVKIVHGEVPDSQIVTFIKFMRERSKSK